jgi:Zn ribbon nucleic-acid-binding protein
MEENKYIEGFNDGFLIATHCPEAAQDLVKSYQESPMPYLEGLKNGIQERQLERAVDLSLESNRRNELRKLRDHDASREKDIDH